MSLQLRWAKKNNNQEKVVTFFSPHYKNMKGILDVPRADNFYSLWSDLAEMQIPIYYSCLWYLQIWNGSDKKATEKKRKHHCCKGQRQLTLVSVVRSDSSVLLCMSLLPASMKRIWEKVATGFFPIISLQDFFWRAANSAVIGWIAPNSRTPPSSHACHLYLQVWKGLNEKQPRQSGNTVFPIMALWELSVAMETSSETNLHQHKMQPFPRPNDASDKIWLQFTQWSEIFMFESVNGRTHFSSGELKTWSTSSSKHL